MVDLDSLAKVCCVFGCEISDLLEYCRSRKTNNQKSAGNRSVPGYIDALYCFGCLTANTCIAMPRPVTPQNTRCMTRACFGPIFLAAACV